MSEIVPFPSRSVRYTIEVEHFRDGTVRAVVMDVADDPRSVAAVWWAVAQMAKGHMLADQIHDAMLARVDALMGSSDPDEVIELRNLAAAAQAYEALAFPVTEKEREDAAP